MKSPHPSQRGYFAAALHFGMSENSRIVCLTGDLGYAMLDQIRKDFPDRFFNVGAAEQTLLGIGIGLASEGWIPFCYSITPFLLCRPFEWLRNYVNHEMCPVRLVGSGLDDDYKHDGITHHAFDAKDILALFPKITTYFPERKEDVPDMVQQMWDLNRPSFLCLRR